MNGNPLFVSFGKLCRIPRVKKKIRTQKISCQLFPSARSENVINIEPSFHTNVMQIFHSNVDCKQTQKYPVESARRKWRGLDWSIFFSPVENSLIPWAKSGGGKNCRMQMKVIMLNYLFCFSRVLCTRHRCWTNSLTFGNKTEGRVIDRFLCSILHFLKNEYCTI